MFHRSTPKQLVVEVLQCENRSQRCLLGRQVLRAEKRANRAAAPSGQRRERYLMVYTPTVSRFGVSHGSPGATVAKAKTADSRMKILHGVAIRG